MKIESLPPITKKFYETVGRPPTKEELELYINIVCMPSSNRELQELKLKKLKMLINKNDRRKN